MAGKDRRSRRATRVLYGAWIGALVGVVVAFSEGWPGPDSKFTNDLLALLFLALCFLTFSLRGLDALAAAPRRPRQRVLDVVAMVACWVAAVAWLAVAVRYTPQGRLGIALLVGPPLIGFAAGFFYLWRAVGGLTGDYLTGGISRLLEPRLVSTDGDAAARGATPTGLAGRREYALDRRSIVARLAAVVAIGCGGLWWLRGQGPSLTGEVMQALFALMFVSSIATMARIAFRWGPALVLDEAGISIAAGLASVRRVPWVDVKSLSLKADAFNSGLVIDVVAPERLIADASAFRRWQMNATRRRYGSPIVVPASFLKCDAGELLAAASAYRARFGGGGSAA